MKCGDTVSCLGDIPYMLHQELVKMDCNVSLLIHVINHNKNITMTSSEVLDLHLDIVRILDFAVLLQNRIERKVCCAQTFVGLVDRHILLSDRVECKRMVISISSDDEESDENQENELIKFGDLRNLLEPDKGKREKDEGEQGRRKRKFLGKFRCGG